MSVSSCKIINFNPKDIYQQEREVAQWATEQKERELASVMAEKAIAVAVQAELERLRNRTPLGILQDEMAELRKEKAELRKEFQTYMQAHPPILVVPLKQNGTPDMRYNTSKTLSIVANNGTLGIDPHHGFGKILQVTYKVGNSQTLVKEVREHETLVITGEGLKIYSAIWFTNPNTNQVRKQADVLDAVMRFVKDM